jgi:hypothetical protein
MEKGGVDSIVRDSGVDSPISRRRWREVSRRPRHSFPINSSPEDSGTREKEQKAIFLALRVQVLGFRV